MAQLFLKQLRLQLILALQGIELGAKVGRRQALSL
jgi:hypothetical protein